jgi:hypothetical protein
MTLNLAHQRLQNQHLIKPALKDPAQVVQMLGAVQSQDFAGAKWALSMRLKENASDESIEQAFTEGKILRTHVLRPTWHFLAPADIRWILELTAPRVHAMNAYYYRQLELDKAVFQKSNKVIVKALEGNKHLTRVELASALKKAGILANNLRLTYLMMYPELEGIICSGPRRGKQFTYALLDERVRPVKALKRDEALAELVRRYFSTRGPATLQDFAWWSGLTLADAKRGIEMVGSEFTHRIVEGKTYWHAKSMAQAKIRSPLAHLLPNYDEYFIGFKDRSAIGNVIRQSNVAVSNAAFLAHLITIDGQLVGGWKRTLEKNKVTVKLTPVVKLSKTEKRSIKDTADRFGKFLGLTVQVS